MRLRLLDVLSGIVDSIWFSAARIRNRINWTDIYMLPECQLFGTLGCHLCEQAEEVLMPLVEHGLRVDLLDIADQARLVDDYGLRIPVLRRIDTGEELDWPFEAEQVVSFLRG